MSLDITVNVGYSKDLFSILGQIIVKKDRGFSVCYSNYSSPKNRASWVSQIQEDEVLDNSFS